MGVTNRVRGHKDCCGVSRCRGDGCSVSLPRASAKACIGGTEYQRVHGHQSKLCDCLVFWDRREGDIVCVVELKAGTPDVSQAARQLQNGATLIEQLLNPCPNVLFVPVLAAGRMTGPEKSVWQKKKIRFNNIKYPITKANCGDELAQVVKRAIG